MWVLGLVGKGWPKEWLGSQKGHEPAAHWRRKEAVWPYQKTWRSRSKKEAPRNTASRKKTRITRATPSRVTRRRCRGEIAVMAAGPPPHSAATPSQPRPGKPREPPPPSP